MADIPHYCAACGEIHGGGGKNPEVEIARINADAQVKMAELARSETRTEVDGAIEQTEIAATAAVDEAVVRDAVLTELATPEPEPEPVVIVSNEADAGAEAEPEPEAEPPEADAVAPASMSGKSGNPWW